MKENIYEIKIMNEGVNRNLRKYTPKVLNELNRKVLDEKFNKEDLFKIDIEQNNTSVEIINQLKSNNENNKELFLSDEEIKKRKNQTANNVLKTKKERKIRSTSYYRNFKKKK